MGCWNGTCGISQLPIIEGERVILFPLTKNLRGDNEGGGYCYSDNQYKPISIPIFGTYDDYGKVYNVDNIGDVVYRQFCSMLKKKEINNPNDVNPQNIEELIYQIERRNLPNIGFMLVHEAIYKKMVAEVSSRVSLRDNVSLRERFEQIVHEYIDRVNELMSAGKNSFQLLFDEILEANDFRMLFSKWKLNFLLDEVVRNSSEELFNRIIDFMLFSTAMDISRKSWVLQAGAGSQDEEYFIHKLIAEFILEKERNLHTEYQEENIDYEENKDDIGKTTIFF